MTEFNSVQSTGKPNETFSTGSKRDSREGKGRYDLLSPLVLRRDAIHMENGAKKYGDRNWEKGQPLSRFLDSAFRHLMKVLEGWKDEDHESAARWNIGAIVHIREMIAAGKMDPELDDLPKASTAANILARLGKESDAGQPLASDAADAGIAKKIGRDAADLPCTPVQVWPSWLSLARVRHVVRPGDRVYKDYMGVVRVYRGELRNTVGAAPIFSMTRNGTSFRSGRPEGRLAGLADTDKFVVPSGLYNGKPAASTAYPSWVPLEIIGKLQSGDRVYLGSTKTMIRVFSSPANETLCWDMLARRQVKNYNNEAYTKAKAAAFFIVPGDPA